MCMSITAHDTARNPPTHYCTEFAYTLRRRIYYTVTLSNNII